MRSTVISCLENYEIEFNHTSRGNFYSPIQYSRRGEEKFTISCRAFIVLKYYIYLTKVGERVKRRNEKEEKFNSALAAVVILSRSVILFEISHFFISRIVHRRNYEMCAPGVTREDIICKNVETKDQKKQHKSTCYMARVGARHQFFIDKLL